jgi:two-component system, LytTR family, response regulator
MKTVIIDDEKDAVNSLELILNEYCSDIAVVGKAHTAIDAVKEIQNRKPDLVFLDIEMPHGTGFDVLDSIPDRTFEVIFTTAYNDYAVKAIKAAALDYILKPVDIEELVAAVCKVRKKINERAGSKNEAGSSLSPHPQKIAIHTSDGVEFVDTTDIIRIEAEGSYSKIFLKNNQNIFSSKNLKEYQNVLNTEVFFRAHNSHLINLLLVKRFLRNENIVEMQDGSFVALSRRNKEEFLELMERLAK